MSQGKKNFKQTTEKLFESKGHELLVFCFFLAVSFGFWLLQALNETLQREVSVRLELENAKYIYQVTPKNTTIIVY